MAFNLIVVQPFGSHVRGDVITDPAEIERVLESEHAHDVVKVQKQES